jgi:probable blue pigment (indigoidine) exporter
VASSIMATSPLVMMVIAWALISERPRARHLVGAGIGIGGVCLMLLTGSTSVDGLGVLASVSAMLLSSCGYILAKRWSREVNVLAATSWQLVAGGLLLLPFAAATEGAPPALDLPAVLGFGYVTVVATALAFAAWFSGLRHLPVATVGLVGLLNPVTGVLLGTLVAGEVLTLRQCAGLALVLAGILLGRPARGWRPGRGRLRTDAGAGPGAGTGTGAAADGGSGAATEPSGSVRAARPTAAGRGRRRPRPGSSPLPPRPGGR